MGLNEWMAVFGLKTLNGNARSEFQVKCMLMAGDGDTIVYWMAICSIRISFLDIIIRVDLMPAVLAPFENFTA